MVQFAETPKVLSKRLRCEPRVIVADKQMGRRFVFVNFGKPTDQSTENIVGHVVIDRRHFANQNIAALAPECVPVAGIKRDALARLKC